ncbi:hypothetical protein BV898_12632 [Hypsibius exemplaris]|uniref:WAP domain-containing protein n=1 Tax=Hypsibius exemplaris TaxID=2072580 RepID=A0A1W0WD26_HYPEX|nr:hypothetical protein BV898_12632 [Hypsibius exemplaris]
MSRLIIFLLVSFTGFVLIQPIWCQFDFIGIPGRPTLTRTVASDREQQFIFVNPSPSNNGLRPDGIETKSGKCPITPIGGSSCARVLRECEADSNCAGQRKCCSNGCGTVCFDVATSQPDKGNYVGGGNPWPPSTDTKAGVCPTVGFGVPCTKIVRRCEADVNCMGQMKCCSDGCGTVCSWPGTNGGYVTGLDFVANSVQSKI